MQEKSISTLIFYLSDNKYNKKINTTHICVEII